MKNTAIAAKDNRNAGPKIVSCTCKHEHQDKQFGVGKRFANSFAKGWQCTVCKKEHING